MHQGWTQEYRMEKIVPCLVLAAGAALAGCAHNAAGLGEQAGTVQLPTGLTLLNSEKDQCAGNVQMDQSSVVAPKLSANLFVQPGEHGSFKVQDDNVKWACIQGNAPNVHTLNCPDKTQYVRLTRSEEGGGLLFECFG